jgi:squalene-associated FAD-dependent desaturase
MYDCIIIGGGLAGLSAAVQLARDGARTALIEARPSFGGRTYSFNDRRLGFEIDNGQHLMMGCYTAALGYIEKIGATDKVAVLKDNRIPFRHMDGNRHVMDGSRWPSTLQPLGAIMNLKMLSWFDRIAIPRVLISIRAAGDRGIAHFESLNAEKFLRKAGQSAEAISIFWEPVILATMNARPSQVSAAVFARVLREAFMSGTEAARMLLPKKSLTKSLVEPALEYLAAESQELILHTAITEITTNDGHVAARTSGNKTLTAACAVLAIDPWSMRRMSLPDDVWPDRRETLDRFQPSFITAFHVVTTKPFTDEPMEGCLGATLQWTFAKGEAMPGRYLTTCIVSASDSASSGGCGTLENHLLGELSRLYPSFSRDILLDTRLITTKRATFIASPGLDNIRSSMRTRNDRVILAGDWTNTGLPATIEGAVRSGTDAAHKVKRLMHRNT